MDRDQINTFFYLAYRYQQDDSEDVDEPDIRNDDEINLLPLLVIGSLISLVILPFVIMMG